MASEQVLEMLQAGEKWDEIQSRVHLDDAQDIIETLLPLMDEEEYEHMIATFLLDHVPHDVLFNYVKNYYINSPENDDYDAAMIMMFYMAELITDHALQIKLLLYLRGRGDRDDDVEVFYTEHVLPSYIHIMDFMNYMPDLLKNIIYRLIYDASWDPPYITEEMRDLAL